MSFAEFDKAMVKVFNVVHAIFDVTKKRRPSLREDKVQKYFEKYESVYQDNTRELHYDLVRELYYKYRDDILKPGDSWLVHRTLALDYGAKINKPHYVARLTAIYSRSLVMADDAKHVVESRCARLPSTQEVRDEIMAVYPELDYPGIFRLRLYQLFQTVALEADEQKLLAGYAQTLSDELRMVEVTPEPNTIAKMLDLATSCVAAMPGQQQIPPEALDNAKRVIGSMITQLDPKKMIESMASEFATCKSFDDVMGRVLEKIKQPENWQQIANVVAPALQQVGLDVDVPMAPDLLSSINAPEIEAADRPSVAALPAPISPDVLPDVQPEAVCVVEQDAGTA